jgi:hypothetical protein
VFTWILVVVSNNVSNLSATNFAYSARLVCISEGGGGGGGGAASVSRLSDVGEEASEPSSISDSSSAIFFSLSLSLIQTSKFLLPLSEAFKTFAYKKSAQQFFKN